jgi:hypothetical protein
MDQWRYNDLALSSTEGRSAMMAFSTPCSKDGPKQSPEEWGSPLRLPARHRQSADLWTKRELTRLRLVCWLVLTDRLVENTAPPTDISGAPGQ